MNPARQIALANSAKARENVLRWALPLLYSSRTDDAVARPFATAAASAALCGRLYTALANNALARHNRSQPASPVQVRRAGIQRANGSRLTIAVNNLAALLSGPIGFLNRKQFALQQIPELNHSFGSAILQRACFRLRIFCLATKSYPGDKPSSKRFLRFCFYLSRSFAKSFL